LLKPYVVTRVVETHRNYLDTTTHAPGIVTPFTAGKFTELVRAHFANNCERAIERLPNTRFKALEEKGIDRKTYIF
jgi:hypothetical protein